MKKRGKVIGFFLVLTILCFLLGIVYSNWRQKSCVICNSHLEDEIYYVLDGGTGTVIDLRDCAGENADWQSKTGPVSFLQFPSNAIICPLYCKYHREFTRQSRFMVIRKSGENAWLCFPLEEGQERTFGVYDLKLIYDWDLMCWEISVLS